jgi:hypothetical protein
VNEPPGNPVEGIGGGFEMTLRQMEINDGLLQLGVSEQHLDGSQIGAGFARKRSSNVSLFLSCGTLGVWLWRDYIGGKVPHRSARSSRRASLVSRVRQPAFQTRRFTEDIHRDRNRTQRAHCHERPASASPLVVGELIDEQ